MTKKKYKMVSINYTNDCAKKPRCSFCYLKKERVFKKLKGGIQGLGPRTWSWWYRILLGEVRLKAELAEQVAIAYNGLHLQELVQVFQECRYAKTIINVTTNPMFLDQPIVAIFKRYGVKMVALSLDSEKCNLKQWLKAAKLLQKKKMFVGANILMLDEMYYQLPNILKKIEKECLPFTQIHLLRPKFYKTKIPLKKRKEMIFLLKQKYKNLFIDECFRWELLGKPCRRGKDFISINADGTVSLCSFDIYRDNKKDIKKCPYI